MKNIFRVILTVVMLSAVLCLGGCKDEKRASEVSPALAKSIMEKHLAVKGFDSEVDFLAEDNVMDIDGVKVYVFAWRTKEGENADRLFGMYAVSADGKEFYEYQPARNEWILDNDG